MHLLLTSYYFPVGSPRICRSFCHAHRLIPLLIHDIPPASAANSTRLIHPSGRIFVTFSTTFFNTRNLKSSICSLIGSFRSSSSLVRSSRSFVSFLDMAFSLSRTMSTRFAVATRFRYWSGDTLKLCYTWFNIYF